MSRAFSLAVLALCLVGCGAAAPAPSPCTPAKLAAIEAEYTAAVLRECTQTSDQGEIVNPWNKIEECPAIGSLLAKRRAAEQEASCR